MKSLESYSKNPMYGIRLDIDGAEWNPEKVSAEEFITEQVNFCDETFMPLLQNLGSKL